MPDVPAAATSLLAADDEEFPDVIPKLMRPEPEPETEPVAPTRGRVNRIGVRGAYMMVPSSLRGTWDPAFQMGAYYRYEAGAVFEFAVDFATLTGTFDGTSTATSDLVFGRFDLLMGRWRSSRDGVRLYFVAGAALATEEAFWDGSGETASRTTGLIDAGLGFGSWNGSWDLRATYTLTMAAETNVEGFVTVGIGVAF